MTGLQYKDGDDQVVQVNAKAVVIVSGGMNNNSDLLKLYANQDVNKIIPLGIGQDGDGHLMVEQDRPWQKSAPDHRWLLCRYGYQQRAG